MAGPRDGARWDVFPSKVDWGRYAMNGTHIWLPTDSSGCCMALSPQVCRKTGTRKMCAACKVVVHDKCIAQRVDTIPKCRMTFCEESGNRGIGETPPVNPKHHIVMGRKQSGKCEVCGKSFQSMSKLTLNTGRGDKSRDDSELLFLQCSWCKRGFHNNNDCSKQFLKEEHCDLGSHRHVVLPPSWIVKLPARKYSFANEKNKEMNNKRWHMPSTRGPASKERRAFLVKPVEGDYRVPLIVFVNPRSGGNQGTRILKKCQYILNPRQVFDLSAGGPHFGLDLYRNVPNLRILVCGGDGSVGWILSEIDRLKIHPAPNVCVLPLGTGNDLARFLGWGGGYADEPLPKIISHVEEGGVQKLDRWDLVRSDLNSGGRGVNSGGRVGGDGMNEDNKNAQSKLPLSVMNNYFSLGADADIALSFHESREANPEKFNSRVKNKLFYGKKGAEAMVRRTCTDLHKCVESLICDGVDLTPRIRELKPISIVFLNISSFGSGTSPWGVTDSEKFMPQKCDDGYLEVVGLTTKSLASTRMGGHGIRIFQCKSAMMYTNKKVAMQVDGEPCRLIPSKIHIKLRNQANMIMKKKPQIDNVFNKLITHPGSDNHICPASGTLTSTTLFSMDYQQYTALQKHDITEIKAVARELGKVQVSHDLQLDEMREKIETMKSEGTLGLDKLLTDEWCFLDAKWTSRIYRIDDSQEFLLRIRDVLESGIFVLDLNNPNLNSMTRSASPQPLHTPPTFREANAKLSDADEDDEDVADERPVTRHSMSFDLSSLKETSENAFIDFNENNICSIDSDEDNAFNVCVHSDNSDESDSPTSTSETDYVVPSDIVDRERALFGTAKRGNIEIFKEISAAGTCLFPSDERGRTPLHLAVKYGHKDVVNFIVEKVSEFALNIADNDNRHTPLHVAALYKRRTICRTLVSRGACATTPDADGHTPRELALNGQDLELAKYLRWHERLQEIAADDNSTAV